MSRPTLSEKQLKVYNFLVKKSSSGLPPTVREICVATGIKSTSTVHAILSVLEDGGYIYRDAGCSRAIRIEGAVESAAVPVLGRVTAGQPILAVEQIEDYIPYPTRDAEGLFALRVEGYSMKNVGIMPGDIVVADKNAYVRNGDIIIGMDGDEATVKRLEKLGDGTVVFMPENEDFDPIYPENPSVLGKVIGSYRKY
ncbi:MAG: transcriptional repressor LexA [Acutalibacteraceae bacterium]|nr:repressor LexA [Clostridia bacterium]MEE1198399.1 transcriptional repressor LexA [Acutalibacteraceae bacterium]